MSTSSHDWGWSRVLQVTRQRVIVVGGGASGLMAAGSAAEKGAEVVLLERMREPGRKLRLSGKGRCNLTNTASRQEHVERFGRNGRFLHQALARFSPEDLVAFFNQLGVGTTVERGGRVFPEVGGAAAVVEALERWVRESGAELITGARVRSLDVEDGRVIGLSYDLFSEDGKAGSGGKRGRHEMEATAIVLATGGKSYPATGSSGDGFSLASAVGHTIVEPRPALVPLMVKGGTPRGSEKLTLRNIEARLLVDGACVARELGEMMFTAKMLAGPVVLKVSSAAVDALSAGSDVRLSFDLKPALNEKVLDARLIRDLEGGKCRSWGDLVSGLLPRGLIPACLEACGIPTDKPCHQIGSGERATLRSWLKDYGFRVVGHGSFKEAIVTAGGVDTREVDPKTMESRLVTGQYIAGELLDLNADTGGFNLQAAFSTGRVAGIAVAHAIHEQTES